MDYMLVKEIIELCGDFESMAQKNKNYTLNINGFKQWIADNINSDIASESIHWEGKEKGRSPESFISTLIVHMSRYAKTYSRSAIHGSEFSTQEDFIYLINLKAFGSMSKTELIRKNVQDKPSGMQIINRLINNGWVIQKNSENDKRSKVIQISTEGIKALEKQMGKIRMATNIVTGNLTESEKMELIRLLNKLELFHQTIYQKNYENSELLKRATEYYMHA